MPIFTGVSPRAAMIGGALSKPAAVALSSVRRPNPVEIVVCIFDVSRVGLLCPFMPCSWRIASQDY